MLTVLYQMSSSFNITEATYNHARNNCATQYAPIATGTLKYTSSCLLTNATSEAGIRCLTIPPSKIPGTADCQYLIQGRWENPIGKRQEAKYYCYTLCQQLKSGSNITSTPSPTQAPPSSGSLALHPSFSLLTFFTLLFFMFAYFRPKH